LVPLLSTKDLAPMPNDDASAETMLSLFGS
jgi:hypothetical protein